jgi:hypothetical protein
MMPKMLDLGTKSSICTQYRQGKSVKQIALQMGYTTELVQRVLKLYGLLTKCRPVWRQEKLDEFMAEVNSINGTKYKVEGSHDEKENSKKSYEEICAKSKEKSS